MREDQKPIWEICFELENSMTKLVRDRSVAEILIWKSIYELIKDASSAYQADCIGVLDKELHIGDSTEITKSLRDDKEMQNLETEYGFSDKTERLGRFWKELLTDEKKFRLKILNAVTREMRTELLPYVKKRILDWDSSAVPEEYSYSESIQKRYRGVIKQLRGVEQITGIVLDVMALRGDSES